jgi:hypothetical protein
MWVYICRPVGDVAQLVEQRIENPCVGGSIPSITTRKPFGAPRGFFMPQILVISTILALASSETVTMKNGSPVFCE